MCMYVCMYVCICVCMCTCMCINTCIYTDRNYEMNGCEYECGALAWGFKNNTKYSKINGFRMFLCNVYHYYACTMCVCGGGGGRGVCRHV